MISIAIDGPSGAGKSTIARLVAGQLGYIYVDTGALYRAVGLAVLRAGKDPRSEAEVAGLLPGLALSLRHIGGEQRVFLGGEDVSDAIREEPVSMAASGVSAHPATRAFLLETQRRLARENNVVMDGRDIGTVVLPGADVKIFLTASVEDRARRRYEQLLKNGQEADYETVKADVEQRDYNDTHRSIAPLKKAADAVEADTTGFELEQSLALLLSIIRQKLPARESAQ
ncbi:MAG: (d)CMP kinase [Oscillospiraceae bacterium]